MLVAPLPPNETERLAALDDLRILHTLPERAYDDLVRLASHICGTPIALVSLVGRDEQWFKARVGLDAEGTPRELAFCAHAILEPDELFVVPDAAQDPRFHDHPLVTGGPRIRFYAGAPLVAEHGEALGTLCVIGDAPRRLAPHEAEALRALARTAMTMLEDRRTIRRLEDRALDQEAYLRSLEAAQREVEAMNVRLAQESLTDALTGLHNRRAFQQRLEEEVARATRSRFPLSLVLLDVDRFKAYNDDFGHPAGDEVLAAVAGLLASSSRVSDLVFRHGGEEFAILLPGTAADGAAILAERYRRALAGHAWPRRPVTASAGVATLGGVVRFGSELVAAADAALYAAKRDGRNRVVTA